MMYIMLPVVIIVATVTLTIVGLDISLKVDDYLKKNRSRRDIED